MSASLGGLIKDFRLQKGISQFDIAFAMGWKEPSRLSRIEQGKVSKPPREIVERLGQAMQLNPTEKNSLLLVGNYLPSEEEIVQIRQELQPQLLKWPYPATVLDFSWRVIDQNGENVSVYQQSKEQSKMVQNNHLRILDIFFAEDFSQNRLLPEEEANNWHKFLSTLIFQFKYEQKHRTNEKWYIEHIKRLMNNKLFREIWSQVQQPEEPVDYVGKHAMKRILKPGTKNQFLHFYLFVVPVLKDPRFEMEMLVPSDLETYQYFQK